MRPSGYAFERDRRQLLAYCYLWRRLGHPQVSGALVYVDIETGEEVSIDGALRRGDADRDIERRLAPLLAIWQRAGRSPRAQGPGRRDGSPSRTPRRGPIQDKLIEAVAHGGPPGREPARRGADGLGQDGRRALPRAARRA